MIRVSLPAAPANFEEAVARPGRAFLVLNPTPTNDEWARHRYWSSVHEELYNWHKGVCVYCASWTPRRPGSGPDHTSIDHYFPKSKSPMLAYDWSNFRLARAKLNNRKNNFDDVIDPIQVQNGWFKIDFATFLLRSASELPPNLQKDIEDTIARLALNSDQAYVNERARAIYGYVSGSITFGQLERLYPFIAIEMQVQNFDQSFRPTIQAALAKRPWLGK